ncbi:MAG: glycoside hydrolase family 3 N-terminal domain-containing protein [Bacteroidota bacterium]
MKRYLLTLLILFTMAIPSIAQSDLLPFQNPDLALEERLEDLLGRMTVEEKASQLRFDAPAIERLDIPSYNWWNECLHGVARNGRATVFPQAIGMAATFDTALMHRIGDVISTEARAKYNLSIARDQREIYQGLTFWSPNVNLFRDPRWGRGQETYGEDPFLTARMGVSFVQGLQGDHPRYLKAAGMAKHYAVHSGPEALRHEFDAEVGMKDLWETYLPAFEALVTEAKVEGVMGAYNRTNGKPCCAHPYLMQEILRKKWGFDGYFVSDCWAIVDFFQGHKIVETPIQAAALALETGCNLNCGSTYQTLMESLEAGLITEEMLDANLRELLPTRFRLGLFDPVGSGPFDQIGAEMIATDTHLNLSREAATKSMVLLKNNGVLPLSEETNSLFVTGPMATHTQALIANYYGMSPNLYTFLEGIVASASPHTKIQYSQGALLDEANRNPMDWFSGQAQTAEVTIACVGISQLIEGEEGESIASKHKGDRVDIGLPQNQIDFLKTIRSKAQKLVVVITSGSAIACPEVYEMADAVIYAWYPGEQGGLALGDLLFGKQVPSGRLPVTVPYAVEDLPPYEDYAMRNRTYRYMEKEPLFPFGFGLSYTTFAYTDLQFSAPSIQAGKSLEVSFTLKNTGPYKGEEVVQLYIRDEAASTYTPIYSLQGFQRVRLDAGQSQDLTFTLTPEMMELVNEKGERILEKGKFKVFVGGSQPSKRSQDLGSSAYLEGIFELQ